MTDPRKWWNAGALTLVLWNGPVVLTSMLFNIQGISDSIIGGIMIVVGVLSTSFWNILVVRKMALQIDDLI